MNEVVLPWPPKELSPNARLHWARKSKITKAHRLAAFTLAREAGWHALSDDITGRLHLWLTFVPPDRRRRDDDNALAAFKAARDGLADALGIDDNRFVMHPFFQHDDVIGGFVRVRVTDGPGMLA